MNMYRAIQAFGLVILIALSSPSVFAAEERIYTRETTGIVRNMNLAEREAIISGYRYYFGNPIYGDASDVNMYGSDHGAFEMLQVGMKVRIRYAEYGHIRYVTRLEQLSPDARNVEG